MSSNVDGIKYSSFCRYKAIYYVFLVAMVISISACSNSALLVANGLAHFGDYTRHADIEYSKESQQKLDLYMPTKSATENKSTRSTVIFFYGGCWGACSELNKSDYRFVAQAITEHGINVVIVDYSKYPDVLFPEIMKDAVESVKWVNQNIDQYGGDKEKIYLMGHSAGAHIASMLTYNENYLQPEYYKTIKGFIGLSGPYDFLPFTEDYQPILFSPEETYPLSQTINFVDGTEPTALLMYGNDDERVKRRNIESLEKIIKIKKGKVITKFYNDIDHVGIVAAFSIPLRSSSTVLDDVLSFIL